MHRDIEDSPSGLSNSDSLNAEDQPFTPCWPSQRPIRAEAPERLPAVSEIVQSGQRSLRRLAHLTLSCWRLRTVCKTQIWTPRHQLRLLVANQFSSVALLSDRQSTQCLNDTAPSSYRRGSLVGTGSSPKSREFMCLSVSVRANR
jgi:hypothetical protein